MKASELLAAAAIMVGLCGCQTTQPVAGDSANAQATAAIVDSPRELRLTPIVFEREGEPVSVRVNLLTETAVQKLRLVEGDPVLARIFALPQAKSAYAVRINAEILGGRENPSIYYPRMTFLDADFNVTRHTTQKDFRFRAGGSAGLISANMFVNEHNGNERYLLVAEEPPKGVDEQLSLIAGQAPAPMLLPLPLKLAEMIWVVGSTSNEPARRLKATRTGAYEISFTPHKSRKLGE